MNQLRVSKVCKKYRNGKLAVDDVTFTLGPGVFGLLGKNGAGKSTLLRIIATITNADSGTIFWNDIDVRKHPHVLRSVLGYVAQDSGVYPSLTATEFLMYVAALKGVSARAAKLQITRLLEIVNLSNELRTPLASYSGGMHRRVSIAQALLGDPQLLVLDEPTVGLDPLERGALLGALSELALTRVVILSTHIGSDIDAVAQEVGVMEGGKLIACAPRGEFLFRDGSQFDTLEKAYIALVTHSAL